MHQKYYEIKVRSYDEQTYKDSLELLNRIFGQNPNADILDYSQEKETLTNPKDSPVVLHTLDDVIGLEEVKECFRELADYTTYKKIMNVCGVKKLPKAYILYGPPGTGKDYSVEALVGEALKYNVKMDLQYIAPHTHFSKYIHDSSGAIQKEHDKLVEKISKKEADVGILYFTEMDSVGAKRDNAHQHEDNIEVTNALNDLISGPGTHSDIIFMGSTNRISAIDPALKRSGRLEIINCPFPKKQELYDLFKYYTNLYKKNAAEGVKVFGKLNFNQLVDLGMERSFAGADVEATLKKAVRNMTRRLRKDPGLIADPSKAKVTQKEIKELIEKFNMESKKSALEVLKEEKMAYGREAIGFG